MEKHHIMKNVFLFLLAGILLTSCAKNNQSDVDPDDTTKPGTETAIPILSATTFVGNEVAGSSDGVGSAVKFNQIIKLTADKAGNVYVLDDAKPGSSSFKIRKVSTVGVATTIYDGALIQPRTKIFKLLDIASNADGVIYVLAHSVEYLPPGNGVQMANREYGVYKVEAGDLKKVSVSAVTISDNNFAWVAPHNLVDNITLDASGNVYGAYKPTGGVTKVYQIYPNPVVISGNTDAVAPVTLTGDAAGTLYASTTINIVKITGTGVSSFFTFPALKSTFKPKVVGGQAGNLIVYGDIYNAANEFKGTGFYKVKADGTVVSKAIMGNPVNIVGTAVGASGKFYYAIQLNQGGYMIYKATFD
jgi:hypothetical protein